MDNEKLFEFMTKIYSDMQEGFKKVNNEMQETKKEMQEGFRKVDERFCKIEIILENEIKPDIKLALEGYTAVSEKLTVLEDKIDDLSEKVDRHDIRIQVIEGGKSKKVK